MKKVLFLFIAFGCIGITTEIFFTAIVDLIDMFQNGSINYKLQGKSYIWMFPIYGLAGIFFPLFMPYFEKFHAIIRAAIYATGILIIEFITGALLDFFIGSCPWEYQYGWHIMGYIRIDYFPLWAGFGYMIETIVKFLSKFKV
jgi:hypothetical protein